MGMLFLCLILHDFYEFHEQHTLGRHNLTYSLNTNMSEAPHVLCINFYGIFCKSALFAGAWLPLVEDGLKEAERLNLGFMLWLIVSWRRGASFLHCFFRICSRIFIFVGFLKMESDLGYICTINAFLKISEYN